MFSTARALSAADREKLLEQDIAEIRQRGLTEGSQTATDREWLPPRDGGEGDEGNDTYSDDMGSTSGSEDENEEGGLFPALVRTESELIYGQRPRRGGREQPTKRG